MKERQLKGEGSIQVECWARRRKEERKRDGQCDVLCHRFACLQRQVFYSHTLCSSVRPTTRHKSQQSEDGICGEVRRRMTGLALTKKMMMLLLSICCHLYCVPSLFSSSSDSDCSLVLVSACSTLTNRDVLNTFTHLPAIQSFFLSCSLLADKMFSALSEREGERHKTKRTSAARTLTACKSSRAITMHY